MKLAFVFIVLIVSTLNGQQSQNVQNASLDQEFKVKMGQHVEIKTEELQIKFISVLEDSRCPKGEQCITQGNGKIELELIQNATEPVTISLNTASEPTESHYRGYTIQLVLLNPYPVMNHNIPPEDYEAVLEVSVTKNR